LHAFSGALLSPHSANRALPVRVTLTAMWGVAVILVWSLGSPHSYAWACSTWMTFVCSISVLIAVSERGGPNARLRRSVPRNRLLRVIAFPFFSGAANGVTWAALMAATGSGALWPVFRRWGPPQVAYFFPVLFLYALAYGLTAVLIRRRFLADRIQFRHTGLLALGLMGTGVAVPLVLSVLSTRISTLRYLMPPWHLGNVTAIFYYHEAYLTPHMLFAGGWAAIVLVLNRSWLADQIRAFRPPDA